MKDSEFKEKYQAAIPDCCALRTFMEHAEEIMFCWGIAHQIRTGGKKTNCGICEYNTSPEGIAARKAWDEEQRKKRVWDIVSTP
jgi:hypothetical protein